MKTKSYNPVLLGILGVVLVILLEEGTQQEVRSERTKTTQRKSAREANFMQACKRCDPSQAERGGRGACVHQPHPAAMALNPALARRTSRALENLTEFTTEEGAHVVQLNSTFGHISIATRERNGTISLGCTTAPLERLTPIPTAIK